MKRRGIQNGFKSWAQGMQYHFRLLIGQVGQDSYIYSREKTEWSRVQFIGEKARASYAPNNFATPLPTNSQRIRMEDSNFIQDNHCFINYLLNSIICFPIQIPHSAILVQGVPNQVFITMLIGKTSSFLLGLISSPSNEKPDSL